MIIICEKCTTAYNLDDSLINDDGSTVRCTKCRHEFVVYPYCDEDPGSGSETGEDSMATAEEDSLGLPDVGPMPADFDEESGPADEEPFSMIEDEAEPVEEELIPETEEVPGDLAKGDLPALEDLEDFDEELLAEEDESAAGEQCGPDAELLLEEETAASTDGLTDEPEGDILDLSDIEDLVNSGDFPGADEPSGPEANEEPLHLEPEEDDSRERMDPDEDDEPLEELYLSEIEKMPAEDDGPALEEPFLEEDGEPELFFEDFTEGIAGEADPEPAEDIFLEPDAPESEPQIEIQFEPEDGATENGVPGEPAPAGEIEPEILFEEPLHPEGGAPEIIFEDPTPAEFEGETFLPDNAGTAAGLPDSGVTAVLDGDATLVIDSPPVIPTADMPVTRRKNRKPLLAVAAALIAVAAIALAGALAGFKVADVTRIVKSVPPLGDLPGFEKKDPAGNLRIFPLEETVSGAFIDNAVSGRLFVIKGRVRNAYNHPRSRIKIVGRLYQEGNRLSKTTRVYCGNILSDAELESMDMGMISLRLEDHRGENQSHLTIEPGRSIPFMIVFSRLPDNLEEYSIQVDSSSG